jgi:hypothetical protein
VGSGRRTVELDQGHGGPGTGARRRPPLPEAWRAVNGAVGNRQIGRMLQRAPTATAKPSADQATREEVLLAEEWIVYLARRGLTPKPTKAPPARYAAALQDVLDAIFGAEGKKDADTIARARGFLKALKAEHQRVAGQAETYAFSLAEVALERADANRKGEAGGFGREGATQLDLAQTLAMIWTEADEELAADKAAGYTIPARLETLGKEAQGRFETARRGWDRGAPSGETLISAIDEQGLVAFRGDAMALIGSMRAKRVADEYRARQAEAEALRATADRQLAELRVLLADRRHGLYMAGEKGKLKQLHEATGEITRAIDDVKHAAAIITDRVDTLNKITEFTSGKTVINLPKLPKGVTDAAKLVKTAHDKIGKALELLDLMGPSKTSFDEGLKYLKGVDMAIDQLSGKNPVLAIYVNSYLGPALKNCIKQLGELAGMFKSQNRGAISAGMPNAVHWAIEPGGEAMYYWLVGLFRQGPDAPLPDAVYSYLDDQDDDISAAVNDPMPGSRGSINGWAHRNRYAIWEAMYGSARPPN